MAFQAWSWGMRSSAHGNGTVSFRRGYLLVSFVILSLRRWREFVRNCSSRSGCGVDEWGAGGGYAFSFFSESADGYKKSGWWMEDGLDE